ncbi:9602_t:CDS:2, partial [Gigaspora margarita]
KVEQPRKVRPPGGNRSYSVADVEKLFGNQDEKKRSVTQERYWEGFDYQERSALQACLRTCRMDSCTKIVVLGSNFNVDDTESGLLIVTMTVNMKSSQLMEKIPYNNYIDRFLN